MLHISVNRDFSLHRLPIYTPLLPIITCILNNYCTPRLPRHALFVDKRVLLSDVCRAHEW